MFKANWKYIAVFIALFGFMVVAQYLLPTPVNWSRNYLGNNKSPFGCYALLELLTYNFEDKIQKNEKTLYQLSENKTQNNALIIINDEINFSKLDYLSLLKFIEQGNSALLVAENFSGLMADSLHLRIEGEFDALITSFDSLANQKGAEIQFTNNQQRYQKYRYPKLLQVSGFSNFDSTRFKVNAFFDAGKACVISTPVGKGKLVLATMPGAFGNYFVAGHPNRKLVYTLIGALNPKQILWDEYYKSFRVTNTSLLKYIFENDALYKAYLLLLVCLILYMVFEGRRRQRAIPVINPPGNTTLEFVNVMSHVYYNSKNHHYIANEKIRYFYESIRKKFQVDTNSVNDTLFEELSVLSGIERRQVKRLFEYCEQIKATEQLTEYDLIELNRQMHNFNKNSLR